MDFRITRYLSYILILIAGLILSSCQSSVRFSSDINSKSKSIDKAANSKSKYDYKNYEDFNESAEDSFIQKAESWIGVPYTYGGESRRGVDCSAFVQLLYSEFGIDLPRTSSEQYNYSRKIDYNEKDVGDLIFFKNKGQINHVGIYIGDETMIHSSTSKGVMKQSLSDPYYKNKYAGTGRVK